MDQISIECVSQVDREVLLEEALRYAQSRARLCTDEIDAYEGRVAQLGAVLASFVREGEAEVERTASHLQHLMCMRQNTFELDALSALDHVIASERQRLVFIEGECARRVQLFREAEWRMCPAVTLRLGNSATAPYAADAVNEHIRVQLVENTLFGLLAAKVEAERRLSSVESAYTTVRKELGRCKGQLQESRDQCEQLEADLRHVQRRQHGRQSAIDDQAARTPRMLSVRAHGTAASRHGYEGYAGHVTGCALCAANPFASDAEPSLFHADPAALVCFDTYSPYCGHSGGSSGDELRELSIDAPKPPPKTPRRRSPHQPSPSFDSPVIGRRKSGSMAPPASALRRARATGVPGRPLSSYGPFLRRLIIVLRSLRRLWFWLIRALAVVFVPTSLVR
eukprot:Opistho-2@64593